MTDLLPSNDRLVLNPSLEVDLWLSVRVGTDPPRRFRVRVDRSPDLASAILDAIDSGGESAIESPFLNDLRRSRLVVLPEEQPPRTSFECTLEDVREGALPAERSGLRIQGGLTLQRNAEDPPPVSVAPRTLEALGHAYPRLWIEDPGTAVLGPMVMDSESAELVLRKALQPEREVPLSDGLLRRLATIGITRTVDQENEHRACTSAAVARAREHLLERGFATIDDVLPALFAAAFRRYAFRLHEAGAFREGDGQVPLRDVIHDEPITSHWHHQLAPLISAVTGEELVPSYCYLVVYREGAVLDWHLDRDRCAWNVSYVLDDTGANEGAGECPWPLHLEYDGSEHAVRAGANSGIVYQGSESPHWRTALGPGRRVTVALFHFVRAGFKGLRSMTEETEAAL